MKRFIIFIVIYFSILFIIDLAVGNIGDYMYMHSKQGMHKETVDLYLHDKYDIIILGSSRAQHHYIPQIIQDSTSLSCYNAGIGGNGILMMYGVYQMIVERYKPKLIMYDLEQEFDINVFNGDNNCTRYIKNLKPFYKKDSVASIIKDISIKEYLLLNSGFYRYNTEILEVIKEFFISTKINSTNGYIPLNGYINDNIIIDKKNQISEIEPLKLQYIKKLIDSSIRKEIKLVFLMSPKYKSNDKYQLKPILDYCKQKKIPVIDYYNNKYFQDRNFFKDRMHLNNEGATEYTKRILTDLYKYIEY